MKKTLIASAVLLSSIGAANADCFNDQQMAIPAISVPEGVLPSSLANLLGAGMGPMGGTGEVQWPRLVVPATPLRSIWAGKPPVVARDDDEQQ